MTRDESTPQGPAPGSVGIPNIEPVDVGVWNDTQLLAIDQLMVEAEGRDIKLIIALHDGYVLGCWSSDVYVDCNATPASSNDVVWWYQHPSPVWDFDLRMKHIVNHRNAILENKRWAELGSHIYAFNIQNEGQGHLNYDTAPVPNRWCDRAKQMRNEMGKGSTVPLIFTGGGNEFLNSDVEANWNCPEIDLVGIHSYLGAGEVAKKMTGVLSKAKSKGKLVWIEEFGGKKCAKTKEIQDHINVFNGIQTPWADWLINKPGKRTSDYEFWMDEESYNITSKGIQAANFLGGAQNFPNLPSTQSVGSRCVIVLQDNTIHW